MLVNGAVALVIAGMDAKGAVQWKFETAAEHRLNECFPLLDPAEVSVPSFTPRAAPFSFLMHGTLDLNPAPESLPPPILRNAG